MDHHVQSFRDAVRPEPREGAKPRDNTEHAIARNQWHRYERARDAGHGTYVQEARRFSEFYRGIQWDPVLLRQLQAEGRPALTINMILSTVNVLLGEQSSRRVDIRYKPRDDSADSDAHALTKLAMAVADQNKFDWLESQVFSDGIIEDRGYFDVRMNFDRNMQGEIAIDTLDPKEVLPDPDARSWDPAEWNEVFVTRWYSLDDIEVLYGEKNRKKIESLGLQGGEFSRDSIRWDYPQTETFGDTDSVASIDSIPDNQDSQGQIRAVRVIDRQYYRLANVWCLVDSATGNLRELPMGTKKSEAEKIAAKFKTGLYPKTVKRVRWCVTADKFVLHDQWSPYKTFTVIPYFPYFRRGKPFGLVRNLVSPQEQFNKINSQELHIINSTANSGWALEQGSLIGMTADELATKGSQTGLVVEYRKGATPPEKIRGNPIPAGIERFGQKAHSFFRDISGINNAMLGMESAEVSGVALKEKKSSGSVQIDVPMDSLARTRHLIAEKIKQLIQGFYTEERLVMLTHDQEPGQPQEAMSINQPQTDGSVLNDVTTGDYDVVITTMPSRDSFGDVQFGEAINLRQAGVMIPDHQVVMYSNLANKAQVAEEIKQMQGLGEKSEEQIATEQMLQELNIKTLQAQLTELEAKAEQIKSQAHLNYSKAGETDQAVEFQLRELEQAMAKTKEEIGVRERLAELAAINKLDVTQLQNKGRLEQIERQAAVAPKPASGTTASGTTESKPKSKGK